MQVPPDALCRLVLDEMDSFKDQLTSFEVEFLRSNTRRLSFTDRQKEIVREFILKYDMHCTKGYK